MAARDVRDVLDRLHRLDSGVWRGGPHDIGDEIRRVAENRAERTALDQVLR